ncbi:MlaD family protein [Jannaschia rubra]|uniref:Virulence factor Mce family protein n=1 Tax=Jannaschia rubra TaxID=282197 RepID=A0A0M6XR30_9RHOB|nr:MlaD family protein [Jannaschia rubra]CTQ33067.1 virulence factor Mce family protein [Jannaschia rubra]SFG74785.1 phospholipid/cholesterol/gamma-HCH transport system substrate-binding protein [Jannaschia rubra]
METRANFILIGAFTLAGIIGTLLFFVWLASVQIDRQYESYGILFDDVSGLDASGNVSFNGISVGRVIALRISEDDGSKVLATIEVDASTPVREDTVAQLSSQGVTGVAYVSLSNSRAEAPPLTAPEGELPIIPSRRSTVQALVEDAPDLISEATNLLTRFQEIAGPENQTYVTNILRNLDAASGGLEQALTDFSEISNTVGEATAQIGDFTNRLDTIGEAVETTLGNADETLNSATSAFDAAETTMNASLSAIDSAGEAFRQAETIMRDQVPGIVTRISETTDTLNAAVTDLSAQAGSTLGGFEQTADLLNARLAELETTLAEADAAFAAVTEASDSFDTLVDVDGTEFIAEARAVLTEISSAVATIETVIDEDVPVVVADIRSAVATASAAVERVATDLTDATGQLDPLAIDARAALTSATQVFDRATQTLNRLEGSLDVADGALVSAQSAFDGATDVLSTDLGPAMNDIRSAAGRIETAAGQVSDDLPAITSDLRSLIARADDVVAQVQSSVAGAAPGLQNFTNNSLPELGRLANEARGLVQSLNQLVRRVERDPARFLLDERVPEYRR